MGMASTYDECRQQPKTMLRIPTLEQGLTYAARCRIPPKIITIRKELIGDSNVDDRALNNMRTDQRAKKSTLY